MTNEEFDKCKAKAVKNVAALDKSDKFKDRYIGTIAAALEAGLRHPETNAAFDALVMLEDRDSRRTVCIAPGEPTKIYD
jgi:hypothetical protein